MNQPADPAAIPQPWKEILATAVHDMRTPLSSMSTTLEVLRQVNAGSASEEPAEKLIAMMERQVTSLAEQLDRLLHDPHTYVKRDPDHGSPR